MPLGNSKFVKKLFLVLSILLFLIAVVLLVKFTMES
jgi:hypothetical protein